MKSTASTYPVYEHSVNTSLWDEFVSHMDSLYFSGASELLDTKTIAFEYHSFTSYITPDSNT